MGVILDYDAEGRLIAIEILDASTRIDGIDTVQLQVIPKPGAKQPWRRSDCCPVAAGCRAVDLFDQICNFKEPNC